MPSGTALPARQRVRDGTVLTAEFCDYVGMPCLLLIIVLAFPRVVLALMFLLTNYLQRAYASLLILVLGFLFLPITTIVYAWLVNSHMPLAGVNLLILIIAVIIDVGGLGGGEWHRRSRW